MEEKQKVWIRGRKGCGDEIKGILTGLGATDAHGMRCENEDAIYFINHKNKISCADTISEVALIIMDNYKEIELPQRQQPWKDGDVLLCDKFPGQCAVFKKYREDGAFETYLIFYDDGISFNATAPVELYRLPNEKELEDAAKMFYAMARKMFEVSKKLEKK